MDEAAAYELEARSDDYAFSTRVEDTRYELTGLEAYTEYEVRIRALVVSGNYLDSEWSAWERFKTLDKTIADEFDGGSGTEEDPYLIARPSQLALLAQCVNEQTAGYFEPDVHYLLTADLDLSGYENWTPIGTGPQDGRYPYENPEKAFQGVFDGGGHTVNNLNVAYTGATTFTSVGLFGVNDGTIRNLHVAGTVSATTSCTDKSYVIAGGIVGQLWRSAVQYSKFFGEISYPLNQDIEIYTNGYFGGIAGDLGIADNYFDLLPIEGKSAVSILDCCAFTGSITTDSMSGSLNTSEAGGLASRGFIGYIYNSIVQHASISGGEAFAVMANDSDLPHNISTGIVLVSDTELKGETKQSITASQNNAVLFASSDIRADDPEHYTPISDWTNLPVEAPLDPSRWKIENGRYTLIYAGLLPEDELTIMRNLQIRDGTIFPRS